MRAQDEQDALGFERPSTSRTVRSLFLAIFLATVLAGLLPTVDRASSAVAASVSVSSVSTDPTEEEPVTITVSGATEANRTLYVLVMDSGYTCSSLAYGNYTATELSGSSPSSMDGDAIPTGDFSRQYTFTPASSGSYRICTYVAEGITITPNATSSTVINVRTPTASFQPLGVSTDPTEEEPVTITVSGATEANRTLYVLVMDSGYTCSSLAYGNYTATELSGSSASSMDGDAIPTGDFSRQYTFTPASSGSYRICTYVAEGITITPNATSSTVINVRTPTAQVAVSVTTPFATGATLNVTVTGVTEANRRLYVLVMDSGYTCSSLAYGNYTATELSGSSPSSMDGDAIPAGNFSRQYTFKAGGASSYRVCAYVAEGITNTPNGKGEGLASQETPNGGGSLPDPGGASLPGGIPPEVVRAWRNDNLPRLTAPGPSAVARPGLRIRFSWQTRSGVSDELLVRDNRADRFVVQDSVVRDQEDASQEGFSIAVQKGGSVAADFLEGLRPGDYEWWIRRTATSGQDLLIDSEHRKLRVQTNKVRRLRVITKSIRGKSSGQPGYTRLTIYSTPWTRSRMELKRAGRKVVDSSVPTRRSVRRLRIDWSCRAPGGTYAYLVTATDDFGTARRVRGRFPTVTSSWCRAKKAAERRARIERVRRRQARERAEREAERQRYERARRAYERNWRNDCSAVGGIAAQLSNGVWICRSRSGGVLAFPRPTRF